MKRGSIETSRATSMPACSCGTGSVAATSPLTSTFSCEISRQQRGRVAVDQMQDRAGHHFVAAHREGDAVLAVGAAQLQRIERAEVGESERLAAAARHQRAGFGRGRRLDARALSPTTRRAPASAWPARAGRSRSDRRARPRSVRGTLPTPVATRVPARRGPPAHWPACDALAPLRATFGRRRQRRRQCGLQSQPAGKPAHQSLRARAPNDAAPRPSPLRS